MMTIFSSIWLRQLIKFAIVGTSTFLVDLAVYLILTRSSSWFGHYYIVANTVSFFIAVLWSFAFNRWWTFRVKEKFSQKQYFKFLLISIGGLLLSSLLLYVAVDVWHIYDVIAKFLVAIVVMIWNFSGNKFWTFRSSATSYEA
jgi:putative flippase GtrA